MKKTNNKKTGIQYKQKTNRSTKRNSKKDRNFNFKVNANIIIFALVLIIVFVLSLKFIGTMFTLIMFIGIALILLMSKLLKKLRRKKRNRIIINVLLILGLLICIAVCIVGIVFLWYVVSNAPEFDVSLLERSESTLLYDKDGNIFAELGVEKREEISYDEVSQVFIDALIATEDSRFFQHNGFDAARFLKASIGQVAGSSGAGGASTISMQVIKNSFTDAKVASGFKGIVRKFTDIYLAIFELEETYSKQEIIEFYINVHYMGSGAYGVEQAAQTYFNKSANELNLAEASLLAGLFKSPTSLDPFKNPKGAEDRRSTVLNLMVTHGYITKEERDMAKAIPVESLLTNKKSSSNQYQSYIDQVATEMDDRYDINIYNTPLLVYTNMDAKKQKGMDDIFNGVTYTWIDDVIQAGIAVVDVDTGKIVAIGTGRNKTGVNQWNYASGNKRQIGSTAKPLFDYAPGIEYNNWSTGTLFEDKEYTYSTGQPLRNSDRQYWGWMTLRDSLAYSRNVPALQAFQQVDNEQIKNFVLNLGITPEIDKYGNIHEAHSIGAFTGSNALEMAAAYAAFANGGTYYEPYTVNKIIFRNTNEEIIYESEGVKAMSDATAFMITDILKSAVSYGLSGGARVNGVNVAAKTGTTNYDADFIYKNGLPSDIISDSWIVGYDPEYSIGMWLGYPKIDYNGNHNLKLSVASVERGKLFRAAGNVIFAKNNQDFKVPNSVKIVKIEKGTNPIALPSENTPQDKIGYEYFKVGTEPTEISTKYLKLKNVDNLSVIYDPTTLSVNISWSKVSNKDNEQSYGKFGYKVYKDGKYLGFTDKNYFTIADEENPFGNYIVVTSFEKTDLRNSSGTSFLLEEDITFSIELLVPSAKTYSVNAPLDSWDRTPSSNDFKALKNGEEIEMPKTIIVMKNSNGDIVANITTNNIEEYTITYKVLYDNEEVVSISRKVKIE